MDLSAPLRTIAPTLESAVLEVLANTESALSAAQIARLSRRGTRTGQRPVLERLVEHGLVRADRANTGFLYSLNRSHVLAPLVLAAVAARHQVVERLAAALAGLDPPSMHASVFGSFARGEADEGSDVDLLIVVPDDVDVHEPSWRDQLMRLEDDFLLWTGNRLEPLVFTHARLQEVVADDEPIVDEWRRDSITLSGEPLQSLTDEVPAR